MTDEQIKARADEWRERAVQGRKQAKHEERINIKSACAAYGACLTLEILAAELEAMLDHPERTNDARHE